MDYLVIYAAHGLRWVQFGFQPISRVSYMAHTPQEFGIRTIKKRDVVLYRLSSATKHSIFVPSPIPSTEIIFS